MKMHWRLSLACAVALSLAATLPAAEPQIKALVKGLNNPCGVEVTKSGEIFVSDSAAHKVIRVNAKNGKASDLITGFPEDIYGKGPKFAIGPLGLALLDDHTLIVGGGGHPDGQELVRVYTIPAAGTSISHDEMKQKLGPIGPGEESQKGEGNFYGVAVGKHGVYITSNGDDTKGWVLKAPLENGNLGALKPFIATKVATDVDAPVGITVNKQGHLVVGQMGEVAGKGKDSLLTYYNGAGKLVARAEAGLYDIAALAFSPKSGKLYAVDFAWEKTSEGGLFRLDLESQGDKLAVKAVKIASLDKPTDLAFAADGTLYVTVFGTAKEGSDEKPGALLEIKGDL